MSFVLIFLEFSYLPGGGLRLWQETVKKYYAKLKFIRGSVKTAI